MTLSCGHSKKLSLLPSIFFDLLLPAFQALWIRSPRNIGHKVNDQQAYEHCVCALRRDIAQRNSETAKPWVGRILLHSKRPSLYILYILYIAIYSYIYDIIYIYTIEFPVSRTNQASSPVRDLSSRSLVAFALGEIVQRSPWSQPAATTQKSSQTRTPSLNTL